MTLLRQLWALIWVRWRLLAVGARRLSRGGPAAAGPAGRSFQLATADVPVEGVDYDLGELPAELMVGLDAVRTGLVDHARRSTAQTTRRRWVRRRRTGSLVTAALVSLAVLGAGATALVTGSTGVPEVDRLLGIYEKGADPQEESRQPGPTAHELQPKGVGDSVTIEASLDDRAKIVSTSYVARDGEVCSALLDGDGSGATGDVACAGPARLGGSLTEYEGIVLGIGQYGDQAVVRGFVSSRVREIEGRDGPLVVELGSLWKPESDVDAVRPFLAVGSTDPTRTVDIGDFILTARTDDGRRTTLRLRSLP